MQPTLRWCLVVLIIALPETITVKNSTVLGGLLLFEIEETRNEQNKSGETTSIFTTSVGQFLIKPPSLERNLTEASGSSGSGDGVSIHGAIHTDIIGKRLAAGTNGSQGGQGHNGSSGSWGDSNSGSGDGNVGDGGSSGDSEGGDVSDRGQMVVGSEVDIGDRYDGSGSGEGGGNGENDSRGESKDGRGDRVISGEGRSDRSEGGNGDGDSGRETGSGSRENSIGSVENRNSSNTARGVSSRSGSGKNNGDSSKNDRGGGSSGSGDGKTGGDKVPGDESDSDVADNGEKGVDRGHSNSSDSMVESGVIFDRNERDNMGSKGNETSDKGRIGNGGAGDKDMDGKSGKNGGEIFNKYSDSGRKGVTGNSGTSSTESGKGDSKNGSSGTTAELENGAVGSRGAISSGGERNASGLVPYEKETNDSFNCRTGDCNTEDRENLNRDVEVIDINDRGTNDNDGENGKNSDGCGGSCDEDEERGRYSDGKRGNHDGGDRDGGTQDGGNKDGGDAAFSMQKYGWIIFSVPLAISTTVAIAFVVFRKRSRRQYPKVRRRPHPMRAGVRFNTQGLSPEGDRYVEMKNLQWPSSPPPTPVGPTPSSFRLTSISPMH